ncbi:MAG: DNA mismatch repair endonuclease MutL [Candidatus Eiseniibacteriota bacterium]|nr:MAG: DNA mismatch repair endonuclease MutL [Candidatus Eisenbacteria bacterium]
MKIKKLSEEVVRKIAAGEIIERPSSVVKELVENSIDAGASRITVRIGDPIYREISVSDDGAGMDREDALLSLERHSTSKLKSEDGLFDVRTLGFRGEALPSIAQVSRLTLTTRTKENLSGTTVLCVAGKIEEVSEAGRAPGTSVTVRDLFFNTPVRRRFLKSRTTEFRHVIRVMSSYGLAFEKIHFLLKQDERELLNLPPVERLLDRVVSLYGLQTAEQLIAVERQSGDMKIEGFVGTAELSRANSEHQLFFVNRRWVACPTLVFALREAYAGLLPRDRYPMCILLVNVAPGRVDVNIHPTKREVKFADEASVRTFVRDAVRDVLSEAAGEVLGGIESPGDAAFEVPHEERPLAGYLSTQYEAAGQQLSFAREAHDSLPPSAGSEKTSEGEGAMVPLWQLHRAYVLAQIKGGLVVIDQHAAHERILYEEALETLSKGSPSSQQLLFPLLMDLSGEEFEALLDIEAYLRRLGFDIRACGKSRIIVRGIPAGLRGWREGQLLHDIIDGATGDGAEEQSIEERVARSFACHAAVKAGDLLTLEEMNSLVDRLFGTSMPQGDPHGRPTFVRIPLEELERRLGRT